MNWTPVDIETFMKCYYRTDYTFFDASPSGRKAMKKLESVGLLSGYPSGQYKVTARGRIFIKMLLNTPLPVSRTVWFDSRTNEVITDD